MIQKILSKKLNLTILCLFVLVLFSSLAFANSPISNIGMTAPTGGLAVQMNRTWAATSVIFRGNVSGNISQAEVNRTGYDCSLVWNATGVWAYSGDTVTNISNVTRSPDGGSAAGSVQAFNITKTGFSDGHVGWFFNCTAPGNSTAIYPSRGTADQTLHTNMTVIFDSTKPRLVLNSPGNASWRSNRLGNVSFINLTVSDENAAQCVLQNNLDASINSSSTTASFFNQTANVSDYINGTALGLSPFTPLHYQFNMSQHVNWINNHTGAYLYNVLCNDSAGNTALLSSTNLTFFVDNLNASAPMIMYPQPNNTRSTDYTVLIQWRNVTELNFSLYQVQVDNDSDFSSPEFERNITSQQTNLTIVTSGNLTGDVKYHIQVVAFDMANNTAYSSMRHYMTDSICHTMVSDAWNICGIINKEAINASDLCAQTSCDYVAMYNSSHQFQTHTAGSSTNGAMTFVSGNNTINESAVVFVYVSGGNKTWENRTWEINVPYLNFTLRNDSTGWNIVPILNQTLVINFDKLDRSMNGVSTFNMGLYNSTQSPFNTSNVTRFMSGYFPYNATGGRYVPYVYNKTFNNDTRIRYGSAVWVHFNKTVASFFWNAGEGKAGEIS